MRRSPDLGRSLARLKANIRSIDGSPLVVLVEGRSDRRALEMLAAGRGLEVGRCGALLVEIGGATNIGHFLEATIAARDDCTIAAMCDAAEAGHYDDAFDRMRSRDRGRRGRAVFLDLEICHADLEDELIRAVGLAGAVEVIEANGDLGGFETFSRQPFQRDRELGARLRRFLGTKSGRKELYAGLLSAAVPPDHLPKPLHRIVDAIEKAGNAGAGPSGPLSSP